MRSLPDGGDVVSRRWSKLAVFLVLVVCAALLRVTDANPAMAQTQRIGAWQVDSQPVMDGFAPEWQSIMPIFLPTTSQQTTPPMGGGAIERVAVRSVHWEDRLYVMLEWADNTADTTAARAEDFTDAAAVQFPAEAASTVPSICMGQADQAVNIWQWRADVESPAPDLPGDGYVDSYQFTDDLYFPAREAGNPIAQLERPGATNLVAGGFGTLEATDFGGLEGHGSYYDGRWAVVFSRPLLSQGDLQPDFDGDAPMDVAVAVWDGSQDERNGIKSVSAFTQLTLTTEEPPRRAVPAIDDWPAYTPSDPLVLAVAGFMLIVLLGLGGGWLYWRRRQDARNV